MHKFRIVELNSTWSGDPETDGYGWQRDPTVRWEFQGEGESEIEPPGDEEMWAEVQKLVPAVPNFAEVDPCWPDADTLIFRDINTGQPLFQIDWLDRPGRRVSK